MSSPDSTRSTNLCLCGCGEFTFLASRTHTRKGHKKGEPLRYLPNHGPAKGENREHKLSAINGEAKIALCAVCGPVNLRRHSNDWYCATPFRRWQKMNRKKDPDASEKIRQRLRHYDPRPYNEYRHFKGSSCVRCGFVAEHSSQLDVHHIDNDQHNNTPSNLQTLCANCHRLVTALGL